MDKTSLKFVVPKVHQDEVSTESLSFEKLKTDLLAPKCLGCHKAWSNEALFQDDNRVLVGDPENSKVYQSVKAGKMPVGKKLPDGTREKVPALESSELEVMYQYISSATAVYEKVSFEELKTKVLESKCIVCHKKWSSEEAFTSRHIVPGKAQESKLYD